ncbi:SDR family oxidoreductase [Anoxybacterium hadale]|uniref:SDR family oxidoreductase n=1 Tax=Anoxybacterium hadale TaxID=3408580 RepID=A0ACD1AE10_9FIRM|nr:SDR family oxidoreductase [Clostridiales bacterium]
MPLDIKGKVVIITGGATGLGRAASLEFGNLGAKVAVVGGHNIVGGQETVRFVREAGGEAEFFQCDITKEEQVAVMIASVVDKYGKIDCAFNNAGVGPDGTRIPFGPLTKLSEDTWDKVMSVNLKGTFFCLKHEILQMQKQGKGAIVNTASIGGLKMAPAFGAYGPSKAGVIALTQLAAIENAKNGIRVNVVCPGPTTGTDLMANTLANNPQEEDFLKEHIIPMGKLGTAEDVARSVVWLCSDMSSHTTGQSFSVDGGMHIS